MSTKNLDKKVERLEVSFKERLETIRKEVEHQKFAIVPRGKYKCRRGKIAGVSFCTHSGVTVLLYPYRLDNPEEFVDHHSPDARTYWPYKELVFCD